MEKATESTVHGEYWKALDFEKLKYCFECGICTGSCPMAELLPEIYNPRSTLEKIVACPEKIAFAPQLWLCAWCYKCYRRCPQALKVPEVFLSIKNTLSEKGELIGFYKALEIVGRIVPLPLVTLHVCFHPERAIKDAEVIQNAVNKLVSSRENVNAPTRREEKVAVIGSGPAGLTVSLKLAEKGYNVTVFESLPQPGGMLRKCIPDYRLPRKLLDEEIKFLSEMGIEFKTGLTVGKDLGFEDLRKEGYSAFFVGVGAHKPRGIKLEGEEIEGVMHALDFLWKANAGEKIDLGEKVAVIGGGNVAVDSARMALRLGVKEAVILYRRSRDEMPANPWEVREAEEEGVKIEFLVAPRKILGEGGRVKAIECVRMELGEIDETGRRKPRPIEGSEFTEYFDSVILAVGEQPDLSFLPSEIEVVEGKILVNPFTMETTMPGVFAGGDAVTGPATVIEAILAGVKAAESIDRYLRGELRNE
ncbi:NAD(P)-dependent oxidoreductase [Candidatus Bathyarchaeota archaeon]|nr:MAG: NAD(P)-dependent oxidoreductase [Candidatus Bathyarchaeota archaeon]